MRRAVTLVAVFSAFLLTLVGTASAATNPTFRAAATTVDASGTVTSKQFAAPAATVAGDELVTTLVYETKTTTDIANTPPAGWTAVAGQVTDCGTTSSCAHMVVATHTAAGGAETATWSFASAPAGLVITTAAYSGVDAANPWDKAGYRIEPGGSSTTTHTAPAFTPSVADTTGFAAFGTRASEVWTPGTGLLERADTQASTGASLAADDSNTALASGTSYTYAGTENLGTSVATMFAGNLRPAAAPPPPPPPAGWTTVANDTFDAAGLPAHWTAYNTQYPGGSCPAPSQVQVPGDGYLHLKMEYLNSGYCGANWYVGGLAVNSSKKSPANGDQAIELRWRIVPSTNPTVVRSHRNIPMHWPSDDHGATGYSGEIDYCEGGSSSSVCTTNIHYGNGSSVVSMTPYSVDLTQWHTWRFERRNLTIKTWVDGTLVDTYTGTSTTLPAKQLGAVLQQECSGSGCPPASEAGKVEDIQVDWIKIENPA